MSRCEKWPWRVCDNIEARPCRAAVVAILVVFVLPFAGCGTALVASRDNVTFTINEKQIKASGSKGDQRYLLFTDKGVFSNEDSLFALKYRSSDLWATLKVGGTYRCRTEGWRIPFFSSYANVLECEQVIR